MEEDQKCGLSVVCVVLECTCHHSNSCMDNSVHTLRVR